MSEILDNSQLELNEIPNEILNFSNLQMLYLQGNHIRLLPDDFFTKLSKLTWLDLRDNQLIQIPKSIRSHQYLTNLLLSNNKLESLPNEIGFVPKLKVLQISNNPLKYPDCDVIAGGTKTICAFLRNQCRAKTIGTYEKKINGSDLDNKLEDGCSNTELCLDRAVIPIRVQKHVNKISNNKSTIRFKSFESLKNDENLKELWMNKLRTLLAEQERILQREKNLTALNHWKYNNKKRKSLAKLKRQEPPYGTHTATTITPPQKQENIDDLTGQLRNIGIQLQTDTIRNDITEIGQQIKNIMTIHRKLKQLQSSAAII